MRHVLPVLAGGSILFLTGCPRKDAGPAAATDGGAPGVTGETVEKPAASVATHRASPEVTLAITGKEPAVARSLPAGTHLKLTAEGAAPGAKLKLVDTDTGLVWYDGAAADFSPSLFLLRRRTTRLDAVFTRADGEPVGTTAVTLTLADTAPALYPGLVAEVFRGAGDMPADSDATWPEDYVRRIRKTPYPAYRTAESIHTPPLGEVEKAQWTPPSYFHSVLPALNLAPGKQIVEREAAHAISPGDLCRAYAVRVRITGEVLVDRPGATVFKLVSNLPGKFSVGGDSTENFSEITVNCAGPEAVPIAVALHKPAAGAAPDLNLMWKRPGDGDFSRVPPSALVHRVDAAREAALSAATGDFGYRKAKVDGKKNDDAAVKLLAELPAGEPVPEKFVVGTGAFGAAYAPLMDAFLHGKTLVGDLRAARAAYALVLARSHYLRAHRDQLTLKGFTQTDGPMMRLFQSSAALLSLGENHPALQAEALAARAEFAQYAVSTCLVRPFFPEVHSGANDGYSDDSNLIVNFRRSAIALDDPYAWDAATCLEDSWFRYAPGGEESLTSDGMFTFHNVNGRQMHPLGYGTSWFNRIFRRNDYATPWGYTSEQYRRMSEYLLACEWMYYHGTVCWFANGRHNDHRGVPGWAVGSAAHIAHLPEAMVRAEDREKLKAFTARFAKNPGNTISGNRFFYRNLYAVQRREDYFIDVKMTSAVVATEESFAGAVPWNMSFGDGVTTFMRSGKEFDAIHRGAGPNTAYGLATGAYAKIDNASAVPCFWLFRALSGTTKADDELAGSDRYRRGSGTAAGGVSDGDLGSLGFHYAAGNTGVSVDKFYAFTEDGLVVLNTGVTAFPRKSPMPAGRTIRSNLNQCDWKTDIRIRSRDGKEAVVPAKGAGCDYKISLTAPVWVEQDGIGYLVLPTGAEGGEGKPGTLHIEASERTPYTPPPGVKYTAAHLETIRKAVRPGVSARVFHLWIDHGPKVTGGSCAYFVCMRAAKADPAAWLASPPVEILSNRSAVQAVRDRRDGVTQAFFRSPGKLDDSAGALLFSAEQPLALLWRPETASYTVQDARAGAVWGKNDMTDIAKFSLGIGLKGVASEKPVAEPLPGIHDPDDRYRGAPVTRRLAAAK